MKTITAAFGVRASGEENQPSIGNSENIKYCECGCGLFVKKNRRFVNYHSLKKFRWTKNNLPWNKGLTKEIDKRIIAQGLALSNKRKVKYWRSGEKIDKEIRFCFCGCKKSFEVKINSIKKYINGHSGKLNRLLRETRFCLCGCGKAFKCIITSNKKYFVSSHCHIGKKHTLQTIIKMSNSAKGHKHSQETKNKISIRVKNILSNPEIRKKISESRKGKSSWNKGKHWSNEVKNKIREHHLKFPEKFNSWKSKKRIPISGENNPNWCGGISFTEYGREFDSGLKEQIRFRDNYKCVLCSCSQVENGKELDVHHIDYDKKNNISSNLVSLCRRCHMKTNFKRNYYMSFIKEIMK